ncbi:LamB/YcsF family protein [Arthrobacter sp. NyZ413]|uniref:LamB/YcsF family protein n=1 Tax=Arthrobacter sp. NyZ413 TaxID=3144669 RepID=UPI003BF7E0F0
MRRSRTASRPSPTDRAYALFGDSTSPTTSNAEILQIQADSICVHSDVPNAVQVARRVRQVIDHI